MRIILALLVVVAVSLPALAGDCCSSADGTCCGIPCKSKCPIAKDANGCRSLGTEAEGKSDALCRDSGAAVEENLSKI